MCAWLRSEGKTSSPPCFTSPGSSCPGKCTGRTLRRCCTILGVTWPHPFLMVMTGDDYGSDTDVIPTDASLYVSPQIPDGDIPWWISLRQGRYKYIQTLVENEIEGAVRSGERSGGVDQFSVGRESSCHALALPPGDPG